MLTSRWLHTCWPSMLHVESIGTPNACNPTECIIAPPQLKLTCCQCLRKDRQHMIAHIWSTAPTHPHISDFKIVRNADFNLCERERWIGVASLAFERIPKVIMVRSEVCQKNLFQNIERNSFLNVAVLVWLNLIGWVFWNHVQTSQTHGSIKVYWLLRFFGFACVCPLVWESFLNTWFALQFQWFVVLRGRVFQTWLVIQSVVDSVGWRLRFVPPLPATYMVVMWNMIYRKSWTNHRVFFCV